MKSSIKGIARFVSENGVILYGLALIMTTFLAMSGACSACIATIASWVVIGTPIFWIVSCLIFDHLDEDG